MIFRYIRALFVKEKTVEFYWNAAGLAGGVLLLGSIVSDKENFDIIFSNTVGGVRKDIPQLANPLDSSSVESKERKQ